MLGLPMTETNNNFKMISMLKIITSHANLLFIMRKRENKNRIISIVNTKGCI